MQEIFEDINIEKIKKFNRDFSKMSAKVGVYFYQTHGLPKEEFIDIVEKKIEEGNIVGLYFKFKDIIKKYKL